MRGPQKGNKRAALSTLVTSIQTGGNTPEARSWAAEGVSKRLNSRELQGL